MLSISKPFKGAGRADYYLNLAQEDYYLGGKEPPGFWLGEAAALFRLPDRIAGDDFRDLLAGFSPGRADRLVHNAGSPERRSGWDLTWSVPKSVSVAWSQATPEIRAVIEAEVRAAVRRGIAYLEGTGVVSRRGTDGVIHERARLLFAAFEHSTSRAQDPQLHVHTILINVGVRPDGSSGTLDPRALYRHQLAAGALFRGELATRLERSLGLRARREGRCFELIGVPANIIEEFSKRRAQIEARLTELGVFTPAAAEKAALDTRQVKEVRAREDLFPGWQEIGRQCHWSAKELSWLLTTRFPDRQPEIERARATDNALTALTQADSHFPTRRLVQALAEEAQGRGLDADVVLGLQARLLQSPRVIALGMHADEPHWTTPEMLALERQALRFADSIHAAEQPVKNAEGLVREAIRQRPQLSSEQRQALRHVTTTKQGIRVVSGLAGTGKSTLFAAAREVWQRQGRTVHGTCLAGKAAQELAAASGIASQTIQRTLSQLDRGLLHLDRHSVLLVDEAGMVGTRQLHALLQHCARSHATLVLSGDARQLQPIEAGGGFPALAERFGAAALQDIRRQREPWARAAVKALAEGHTAEALEAYASRGLVSLGGSPESAMTDLLADWKQEALASPAGSVILAIRNADVSELNQLAQAERRQAGRLAGKAVDIGQATVFAGDRVVFLRNHAGLGVCNGQMATLIRASEQQVEARLDSGRHVLFAPAVYPHVQLGYALTTCKAQGLTVERSFIYVDETVENREAAYVQASRARGLSSFYAVAEAWEDLVPALARSRPKVLATSLLPQPGPSLTLDLSC